MAATVVGPLLRSPLHPVLSSQLMMLDYTGGRMLLQVVHELHGRGIDFAVARATGEAPRDTARAGLLRHIGDDHVFLTVDEAVRALGPKNGAATPRQVPDCRRE